MKGGWTRRPPIEPIRTQPRTTDEKKLVVFASDGIAFSTADPDDKTTLKITTDTPTDDKTLSINVVEVGGDDALPQDVGGSFLNLTVWERVV